jgi:hypothetical protein
VSMDALIIVSHFAGNSKLCVCHFVVSVCVFSLVDSLLQESGVWVIFGFMSPLPSTGFTHKKPTDVC